MRQLILSFLLVSSAHATGLPTCFARLQQAVPPYVVARQTPRDVRVVQVDAAWNEAHNPQVFVDFLPSVVRRIPHELKRKVDDLLSELNQYAQLGQIKNLNEWMGEVMTSDTNHILSYICEAEYALFVVKQNARYVVTFEPNGGFYRGHPEDVARLGMRQKSIDLRIHDKTTGQLLAMREVKSSAGRSNMYQSVQDAFEKVQLIHHLQVPEMMGEQPVEIGVVYFYDYDPMVFQQNPARDHSFPSLRLALERYLEKIQQQQGLKEKPFDTFTLMDFGSRRIFHMQRKADDTLVINEFPLLPDTFQVFAPKVSLIEAANIRERIQQPGP